MAKMTLQAIGVNGGSAYSFPNDPRGMKRIRKEKRTADLRTFESHAVFDWQFKSEQSGLKGLRRTLRWPALRLDFFDMLTLFFETNATVNWNPQTKAHTPGATYVVEIMDLKARNAIPATSVRDVELDLEIMAVN